ncbi:MAG: beta-CASP ribonuclease aCPSF1, partial [Thermoprotei archaeon]
RKDTPFSRQDAEALLAKIVKRTIERGGKVLIPVLSLGRAQEIMLTLEEKMSSNLLPKIPVYIDGMSYEATAIHLAYPEFFSSELRKRILVNGENPFRSEYFTLVKGYNAREEVYSGGPCIIIASSGMLTGGPSVEYFRVLASDEKNTIIFVSFQAKGTLGRLVQDGAKEVIVPSIDSKPERVKVNLEVRKIEGFSGHSDRLQLLSFAFRINPKPSKILLFHGEEKKSVELAVDLASALKSHQIEVYSLSNLDAVSLKV